MEGGEGAGEEGEEWKKEREKGGLHITLLSAGAPPPPPKHGAHLDSTDTLDGHQYPSNP